jgi:hypothetical protein
MQYVTQWFRVGEENPSPTKPGEYEVQFSWPGRPVFRLIWNGTKWTRNGMFKPSVSWGDKWRGLFEKP